MKRITSILLALMLVVSVVPVATFSASAAVVPSSAREYNGHTYCVYATSNYSWAQAKAYCEKKGGHLATITSAKENNFVASLVDKRGIKNCWLGATDSVTEGTWKWVTGEKFSFKAWDSGQPDNSTYYGANGEDYLQTFTTSKVWNDALSDKSYSGGFVCEWDMSKKAADSLRFQKSSVSLYYGFSGTLNLLNASGKVTWSSSNTKVATVNSSGKITGKGLGSCYIYAKNGGKTVKCKVTVKDVNSTAVASFKVNGGGYFIKGESTAKVNFKMTKYNCAKVYVYIRNASGTVVYKKTFTNLKKGSYYNFNWNGKDTNGNYVKAGSYRVQIKSGTRSSYSKYLAFKAKNEFSDGNGSKSNPFLVASTSQFKKIVKYPTAYFKQTKNLDFGYTAVGGFFTSDQPFNGVYDGGKKTINNISSNKALFTVIGEKGTVKNVVMKNCTVTGTNDTAILTEVNYGKINNCNVNGATTVTMNLRADLDLGFLVWNNYGTITDCVVSGQASVKNDEYVRESWVGGIATANFEQGKIISCTSHVNMTAKSNNGDAYIGGIVGYNKGLVNDCEADGTLDSNCSGGIVGWNVGQIMSSYYTGPSEVNITVYNSGIIS